MNTATALIIGLVMAAAGSRRAIVPAPLTLGEYLESWLEDTIRPMRRANTYRSHAYIVRHHIAPVLGGIALADLSPMDVQRWVAGLSATDLAPSTVRLALRVLRAGLNQAVRWRIIDASPAAHVVAPPPGARRGRALSAAEARRYIEATRAERLGAMYVLAITCGLRRGELAGLTWACVDWRGGRVEVRAQLVRGELAPLKTASSSRAVPLPALTLDALREWRGERERDEWRAGTRGWTETGFVFVTTRGTAVPMPTMQGGHKRVLRRAGLADCRLHDLRHTAISLMVDAGVPPHVVMAMVGHSRVQQTLDVYSHASDDALARAAAAVQGLFAS